MALRSLIALHTALAADSNGSAANSFTSVVVSDFDVTGLATGQTYYFTVETFNGAGHSLASNQVVVNVGSH